MDNKIIVLVGESGSGKSSISKLLNRKIAVSHTTRKPRVGEIEGVDYYYVSKEKFLEMEHNGEFIEHRKYNTLFNGIPDTWYYGLSKNEIKDDDSAVIVVDMKGLEELKQYFGSRIISFYTHVKEDIRKTRAEDRLSFSIDEWNRRLADDEKVFADLSIIDHIVSNNGNIEDCVRQINEVIKDENLLC